uniref:Uncharacterized protein n=1 Tax=viral metagenome TaxID=1070528 RepID=A0A6C0B4R9_9ZZZZ
MFVSLKKNKWQIIISTGTGCAYYYFTRNEIVSMTLTIILVLILRAVKIDNILDPN